MPKLNSKVKRNEAERAAQWYAHIIHRCVISRKAIRTQFQSVDFFASDIVGKKNTGEHVYIQATAGQASAVSTRRKKLEAIPWHPSDTVELVQLVQTPDPANARKTLWFFRVHEYIHGSWEGRQWWTRHNAVPVPAEWFKSFKTGEEK